MFSQLKIKGYEKRYLESNYSGGGEHTHSGIDSSGHHKLYGSNSLNVKLAQDARTSCAIDFCIKI